MNWLNEHMSPIYIAYDDRRKSNSKNELRQLLHASQAAIDKQAAVDQAKLRLDRLIQKQDSKFITKLNGELNANAKSTFFAFVYFILFLGLILYLVYQYIQYVLPEVKYAWFLGQQDINFHLFAYSRVSVLTQSDVSTNMAKLQIAPDGTYGAFAYKLFNPVGVTGIDHKSFIDVYSNGSSSYFIFLPVVMPLMYNYIFDNSLIQIMPITSRLPYSVNSQTYGQPVSEAYTTDTISYIVNHIKNLNNWSSDISLNHDLNSNNAYNQLATNAYKKFRGSPEYVKLLSSNWIDTVYANKTLPVIQKAAQHDNSAISNAPILTFGQSAIIVIFILICVYIWIIFPQQYQVYVFKDAPEFTIYIITMIWLYVAYMLIITLPSIIYNKIDPVRYPIFYRSQINVPRSNIKKFEHFTNESVQKLISNLYVTNGEIKVKRNLNIQ